MTLLPFQSVTSRVTPLLIDNIDTDVITPIGRVLEGRDATIRYAFEPLRFHASGELRADCPLNDPLHEGAEILLAGANFGCGSSRETAVWAIEGMGFRVVIAPSFGDIFFSNCFKNGVLAITASPKEMTVLGASAADRRMVRVDLEAQEIDAQALRWPFEILPLRRESLLLGLDDLGLVQRRSEAVERFESDDRERRPWAYACEGT